MEKITGNIVPFYSTIQKPMMAMAHTLVSGAIASRIGDPVLAPTLALTSHFILDSIPHWDFGADWRKRTKLTTGVFAICDTLFAFGIAWYLYHTTSSPHILLSCLILSVLPDWLEAPWYIFFANPKRIGLKPQASILERSCYGFYKLTNVAHAKAQFPWGVITQIVTVLFFLLLLFR